MIAALRNLPPGLDALLLGVAIAGVGLLLCLPFIL